MPIFNRNRRGRAARSPADSAPTLHALEPRLLMAGNVLVAVAGNNLRLTGDRFDNQIAITQVGVDEFQIAGLNGTTIGGQPSITRRVSGQFTLVTGAGNDTVRITEAGFNRLTIDTGSGHDDVTLGDVDATRLTLAGGKGSDSLLDLGGNSLAFKISSFECEEYPDDVNDSFALVDSSRFFNEVLRNERAFTIDETESRRLITDYHITQDRRGRVSVRPVYTDIVTGFIADLLAEVSPDRQQIQIEARITQVSLDSVNQLGINTPIGMRYIDQPVLSTLFYQNTIVLPNGATFQPALSSRIEGPLASELSLIVRPTIVDDDESIDQDDLEVELDLLSTNLSANSQSLRSDRSQPRTDNYASELKLLAATGVTAEFAHLTRRLLNTGYSTSLDKDGNRVLDSFSSPFEVGSTVRVTPRVNVDEGKVDLDLDVSDSQLTKVQAKTIFTALGKQSLQLPVLDLVRSQNRVTLADGQTVVLGEVATPGSRLFRDNMQVLIDSTIVNVTQTPMVEIGINFNVISPSTDASRTIKTILASGGSSTFSAETRRFVITDLPSTFGVRGIGAMKTVIAPIITGWNYTANATGTSGSRINGTVTFTESILDEIDERPYGSPFGTQRIVIGSTRTDTVTNKVPVLSDLPILGNLFRNDRDTRVRTNLIVFVTARIISVETGIDR